MIIGDSIRKKTVRSVSYLIWSEVNASVIGLTNNLYKPIDVSLTETVSECCMSVWFPVNNNI
jgi:hypothetical protein